MPISLLRRTTLKLITPYSPIAASSTASKAKMAVSRETSVSWLVKVCR